MKAMRELPAQHGTDLRPTGIGSAKPRSGAGSRSAYSNSPPISRLVAASMTTARGLSQRLQPRGEIGRPAYDRLFMRGALPEHVADHDEAGGDPDPGLQRRSDIQAGHGLDQIEPGL